MLDATRRLERRLAPTATTITVAALSAATVTVVVWLASLIRPSGWLLAAVLWLAVATATLSFIVVARARPEPLPDASEHACSVTTIVNLDSVSLDDAPTMVHGVAALGPCVAIGTDVSAAAAVRSTGVPAFDAPTLNAALSAAAATIGSDGVLVLSDAAFPDMPAAARAAGMFGNPEVGWVTGVALPFNRDGYGPTVRQQLDERLRRDCRAAGAVLWEPDATVVRTRLLVELPMQADELWTAWLRRAATRGWRGAASAEVVAAEQMPVVAERYWQQAVRHRRAIAAGLADVCRHGPWRARVSAAALLVRHLHGWWLALWLVSPALISLHGGVPFAAPGALVAGVIGGVGTVQWATLRVVHKMPLRPARDLLALAYDAPASLLSTPAALTGRISTTQVRLPPRPLGWVAGVLAVLLIATVAGHGGDPGQATAVAGALVALLLVWAFSLHGVVQLLRARSTFRIPVDLAVTVNGQSARGRDASPRGLAAHSSAPLPAANSTVTVVVELDDGCTLSAAAVVRHRELPARGRDGVVGLNLALTEAGAGMWAAQLARTAVAGRRTAEPHRQTGPAPGRWGRVAAIVPAAAAAVVLIAVAATLALPAFGLRQAVVVSASMSPAVRAGDLLILREVPASELAVGDIVQIDLVGDGGTTHRVVALAARGDRVGVTTRGDANPAPEQWELPSDLTVGLVQARVPWIGSVADRLGTTAPREAVTAGIVLLTVVVVGLAWGGRRTST